MAWRVHQNIVVGLLSQRANEQEWFWNVELLNKLGLE